MAQKKSVPGVDFIKEEIKKGPSGVYFFYGEEDFLKQHYLHEIESVIVGDVSDMNYTRLTNDEFAPSALEEALGTGVMYDLMSMMADTDEEKNNKLIELYEVDFKAMKQSDFSATLKLLKESVDEETVVVIFSTEAELPQYSKAHQTIIKEISKISKAVCFPYETDRKLCIWLSKIAMKSKLTISPDVAQLIIARVGHSMLVLKNELDKLISYVVSHGRTEISREDVPQICVANKEISPFDFTNALIKRDFNAAFYILADMKSRTEEPIVILSTVAKVISELIGVRGCMDQGMTRDEISAKYTMHEYRTKLYIEALKNTSTAKLFEIAQSASKADFMMKTSSVDGFTIIERLICELTAD